MSRFVPIGDRQSRCDIPVAVWRSLTEHYTATTWRGVHLDKSPFELATYPMILHELRPATILELGTHTGGSAMWLADHLSMFGGGTVFTVDIDPHNVDRRARDYENIEFLTGDCRQIGTILTTSFLSSLPHPWLVIEDVHVNLRGILDHLHLHGLDVGDYLVIEDTNPWLWQAWNDWPDEEFLARVRAKLGIVRDWLEQHAQFYAVDCKWLDIFGYNASKQWNSILRRDR